MWLHVESQMLSMTKMCEGYTWRSSKKCDQKAYKLRMEHCKNLNLKFINISSTPWHGAMDQDWRSKSHAQKCTS